MAEHTPTDELREAEASPPRAPSCRRHRGVGAAARDLIPLMTVFPVRCHDDQGHSAPGDTLITLDTQLLDSFTSNIRQRPTRAARAAFGMVSKS
jgi:hypothetical protein